MFLTSEQSLPAQPIHTVAPKKPVRSIETPQATPGATHGTPSLLARVAAAHQVDLPAPARAAAAGRHDARASKTIGAII